MAKVTSRPKVRNWADILALFTGVALLGISVWPSDVNASSNAALEARYPGLVLGSHIAAGTTAVLAVVVGQSWRRRPLARALLVLGALVLLGVLLLFREFGPRALWSMLFPAVLLLVAVPGIGPMPRD
jgi:hypothetical protein